ncbi:hypothetical protein ROZALSC1DRAFT_29733 [Rozella allomycis CSF55]|uniref:histidine kinase n=1 Tax=Rozella allomycis (strain CSF55) TaxID=988480 RepID=A0A075B0R8_ROZAC|nr:Histidine kinase-like ATPase, ATP-binding domain-containing protein [Rozella allomycis CSF55]RKP18593.1 hypothetical protein ROZALSC1DRAFT_29733 [Rozella allomycis CSF55]|eukprot:EPZ36139.1 Histidine kinase-like ATPase, ATP-binding domain-containing protein [Rozella allomycis CSF55]
MNTNEDWRFRRNPYTACADGIKFYVGVPINVPSEYGKGNCRIGTFCVIDRAPHIGEIPSAFKRLLFMFADIGSFELLSFTSKIKEEREKTFLSSIEKVMMKSQPQNSYSICDPMISNISSELGLSCFLLMYNNSCELELKFCSAAFSLAKSKRKFWSYLKYKVPIFLCGENFERHSDFNFDTLPECIFFSGCGVVLKKYDGTIYGVLLAFSSFETRPVTHHDIKLLELWTVRLMQALRSFEKISELQKFNESMKETMIFQDEKLKTLQKGLSSFSHEMKTPLYGITGALESATDCIECRELLSIIKECSETMKTVVNDLIDSQSLRATKSSLTFHAVDVGLAFLLKKVLSVLNYNIASKSMNIKVCVRNDTIIHIDISRGKQLLINIIEFSDNGKTIEIFDDWSDSTFYKLIIRDQGIGIDEHDKDKLGLEFFQQSHNRGGLGLGLSICKNIVSLVNGYITLNNRNDGKLGACCTIALPDTAVKFCKVENPERWIYEENHMTNEKMGTIMDEIKGSRIAIVDDNAVCQRILEKQLSILGFSKISVFQSIEKILSQIQDKTVFDIIISDLLLLGSINGDVGSRLLRDLLPDCLIIIVTGLSRNEIGEHCADVVIEKPVSLEELRDALVRSHM